jgi:hypothetical protein
VAVVLQNHRGLDFIAGEKGGRMLLLCKLVRDSERKCMPITREEQDKGKK